jgi:isocitrate dehydrogenase
MMLAHLGQTETADRIKNAWLKTIEDGIHTGDIYSERWSVKKASTAEFADAVIQRLDKSPVKLTGSAISAGDGNIDIQKFVRKTQQKQLVGVDVFIDWNGNDPDMIGKGLDAANKPGLKLKMITNRGVKVYPNGNPETFCTDHWRCRFISENAVIEAGNPMYLPIKANQVIELQKALIEAGFDIIKTENLYEFDGKRGFSLGQGE